MKRGFTLIELLVVVLIIGILSSVALPQYNKAVMKAHFTEAVTNVKSLAMAYHMCNLEGGSNCTEMETLVLSLPGESSDTQNFEYTIGFNYDAMACSKKHAGCVCYNFGEELVGSAKDNDVCSSASGNTVDVPKLLNIDSDEEGEHLTCGQC